MTTATPDTLTIAAHRFWSSVRWLVWGGAGLLLLAPLVAMQVTDEVNWTPVDFLAMGLMLGLLGAAFEVTLRVANSHAYVLAAGIAAAAAFLMTWSNLAVGIIGEPGHPANLMFPGIVLLGLLGAALARLAPRGMAKAMAFTALAQAAATLVAGVLAEPFAAVASTVFVAMWLVSTWLFHSAARLQ